MEIKQMPDFDTAVGAAYWDVHVGADHANIPGNMVAVAPRRCDNPTCKDGCPGVAMIVRLGDQTVEIQFDAKVAHSLAQLIIYSAEMADPTMKKGAH